MSTSSSSLSPPPQPTMNPSPVSTKKPHPVPWTHQETVFLIQIYQDKWYSLKRGQLKANQWEEVAAAVAARCGYDYSHPSKTPIQCRHKMEKLRRRYREEKRRLSFSGGPSSWPYFSLMDSLEGGPMPISARPLIESNNNHNTNDDDDDDDDDEEDEDDDGGNYDYRSKSRRIDYILRRPMMVNRFPGNAVGAAKKQRRGGGNGEVGKELGLAEEIKGFAEQMMWMERKRMEMVRETERWRMEMENKRMEMILDSQKKIADMIANAFDSSKDLELEPE